MLFKGLEGSWRDGLREMSRSGFSGWFTETCALNKKVLGLWLNSTLETAIWISKYLHFDVIGHWRSQGDSVWRDRQRHGREKSVWKLRLEQSRRKKRDQGYIHWWRQPHARVYPCSWQPRIGKRIRNSRRKKAMCEWLMRGRHCGRQALAELDLGHDGHLEWGQIL